MTGLSALPQVKMRPYKIENYVDFTGGLDYGRTQNLADPKFLSDALNVVLLHDGGFASRNSVGIFNRDNFAVQAKTLGCYEKADGFFTVAAGMADGSLRHIPGDGSYSAELLGPGGGGPLRTVQANDKLYILGDGVAPRVWLGTGTPSVLGQAYNPEGDFAEFVPTEGNMPKGRLGAVYHGRFWLADITDATGRHPTQVRWSYPMINFKGEQSWKAAYYTELDAGSDGGTITAMLPTGLSLFIAKEHALYQVTGFDVTDVSFSPVSRTVGAANPDAMMAIDGVLYVWDSDAGLHAITRAPIGGNTPMYDITPLAAQLTPLFNDGSIPQTRSAEVRVSGHVGKYGIEIWCVVPWADGTRRTFMYDTTLKAWTRFDLALGSFCHMRPRSLKSDLLAISTDGLRVLKLDQPGAVDDYGSGPVGYESYATTAKLHTNTPFVRKRFTLLQAIMSGHGSVIVEIGKDWQDGNVFMSSSSVLAEEKTPFVLGVSELVVAPQERITPTAPLTDEPCAAVLGDSLVGGRPAVEVAVPILPTSAQAISVTFRGQPGSEWGLHAMGLKYWTEGRTL